MNIGLGHLRGSDLSSSLQTRAELLMLASPGPSQQSQQPLAAPAHLSATLITPCTVK